MTSVQCVLAGSTELHTDAFPTVSDLVLAINNLYQSGASSQFELHVGKESLTLRTNNQALWSIPFTKIDLCTCTGKNIGIFYKRAVSGFNYKVHVLIASSEDEAELVCELVSDNIILQLQRKKEMDASNNAIGELNTSNNFANSIRRGIDNSSLDLVSNNNDSRVDMVDGEHGSNIASRRGVHSLTINTNTMLGTNNSMLVTGTTSPSNFNNTSNVSEASDPSFSKEPRFHTRTHPNESLVLLAKMRSISASGTQSSLVQDQEAHVQRQDQSRFGNDKFRQSGTSSNMSTANTATTYTLPSATTNTTHSYPSPSFAFTGMGNTRESRESIHTPSRLDDINSSSNLISDAHNNIASSNASTTHIPWQLLQNDTNIMNKVGNGFLNASHHRSSYSSQPTESPVHITPPRRLQSYSGQPHHSQQLQKSNHSHHHSRLNDFQQQQQPQHPSHPTPTLQQEMSLHSKQDIRQQQAQLHMNPSQIQQHYEHLQKTMLKLARAGSKTRKKTKITQIFSKKEATPSWLQVNTSRVDAHLQLTGQPDGSFIVRPSSKWKCMVLSYVHNGQIRHEYVGIHESKEGALAVSLERRPREMYKNLLDLVEDVSSPRPYFPVALITNNTASFGPSSNGGTNQSTTVSPRQFEPDRDNSPVSSARTSQHHLQEQQIQGQQPIVQQLIRTPSVSDSGARPKHRLQNSPLPPLPTQEEKMEQHIRELERKTGVRLSHNSSTSNHQLRQQETPSSKLGNNIAPQLQQQQVQQQQQQQVQQQQQQQQQFQTRRHSNATSSIDQQSRTSKHSSNNAFADLSEEGRGDEEQRKLEEEELKRRRDKSLFIIDSWLESSNVTGFDLEGAMTIQRLQYSLNGKADDGLVQPMLVDDLGYVVGSARFLQENLGEAESTDLGSETSKSQGFHSLPSTEDSAYIHKQVETLRRVDGQGEDNHNDNNNTLTKATDGIINSDDSSVDPYNHRHQEDGNEFDTGHSSSDGSKPVSKQHRYRRKNSFSSVATSMNEEKFMHATPSQFSVLEHLNDMHKKVDLVVNHNSYLASQDGINTPISLPVNIDHEEELPYRRRESGIGSMKRSNQDNANIGSNQNTVYRAQQLQSSSQSVPTQKDTSHSLSVDNNNNGENLSHTSSVRSRGPSLPVVPELEEEYAKPEVSQHEEKLKEMLLKRRLMKQKKKRFGGAGEESDNDSSESRSAAQRRLARKLQQLAGNIEPPLPSWFQPELYSDEAAAILRGGEPGEFVVHHVGSPINGASHDLSFIDRDGRLQTRTIFNTSLGFQTSGVMGQTMADLILELANSSCLGVVLRTTKSTTI
eukprot:m.122067 g.122067  ORF g.122067 m.122067 type:complete len:1310 (+) comp9388_c0_seq1:187-4116(+)